MAATDKWLLISKSHNDSNRCTPCRGNLIHMARMLLGPVHIRFPRTVPICDNLFMLTQQNWIDSLLLRKIAPDFTSPAN
jgi:hypothetical protein